MLLAALYVIQGSRKAAADQEVLVQTSDKAARLGLYRTAKRPFSFSEWTSSPCLGSVRPSLPGIFDVLEPPGQTACQAAFAVTERAPTRWDGIQPLVAVSGIVGVYK